jgi:hypothetical protein
MIRQCAWCCRVLGEVAPLEKETVTHGLCKECLARLMPAPEKAPTELAQQALLQSERNE